MIVKVCGMRNADNIRDVEGLGVDLMGFIFYSKSSRFVDALPLYLPQTAKRVGVFVNDKYDNIINIYNKYSLDYVQLHGDESPQLCDKLMLEGVGVIKAFSVASIFPRQLVAMYHEVCNYFLFDTQTELYGGSGNKFDWNVLNDYSGNTPFLLSGGISVSDADDILKINHPQLVGVDLNSKFETEPALKDVSQLKQFIKQIKQ